MKKILIFSVIAVFALVAIRFSIVKWTEYSMAKANQLRAVPTVELQEVQEVEIYKSIEMPGRIESPDKVDLIARVEGYLQKKHFQEGDFVKKGQLLFTIEPTEYLNNLNKAKGDLENAKARLYKATKDYERGKELVEKDFISKSTYDGLYADKLSAQASVKSANAALAEANRNYGYTQIKSPVNGKIGELQIHEGNYVNIGAGVLATVIKTNPIFVKYSVDSKQFEELRKLDFIPKKGSKPVKVDIILPNGNVYPVKGVQDFWDNKISTSTGTIDFRATFNNDDNALIPGDFVKVKVYSNQKNNEVVIPQDMVLQDSKGKYVYVVDENNCAKQQYFSENGQYENYWIITDGIKKGDKYISTNITKIMPKMPVKLSTEQNNNKK